MLLLIIALFFLFSSPAFATPQVSISSYPNSVVAGSTFTISYVVTADVGTSFYIKALGGIGATDSDINTSKNDLWLSYNSPWIDFPVISVGDSGQLSGTISAKTIGPSGLYNLKLRIRSSTNYDSPVQVLEVISPSPTPTPIPTETPIPTATLTPTLTPVPTATKTPTPTVTPTTRPTATPIPTIAIIPTDPPLTPIIEPTSSLLSLEPSPTASEDILGISDIIKVSPTHSPQKNLNGIPANLIATVFIVIGGLLLLAPLVITRVRK